MNYYISDLHLFHERVIDYDGRPFESLEEMHGTIKSNWNRAVTNADTVYILGDVSHRGSLHEVMDFISGLKGKKILIKGNHDEFKDEEYLRLFEEVCDYKEIYDSVGGTAYHLVLCHYPIMSWKKMGKGGLLLYGHTHNSEEDAYFQACLSGMRNDVHRHLKDSRPRAINVGCMFPRINYTPRRLKEILEYNTP